MLSRRNVLVILGLITLAVVWFFTLRPVDEPKYQGRSLSEWLEQTFASGKEMNGRGIFDFCGAK